MELDELEELFDDLDFDEPSEEHLNAIYQIFKDDFFFNKVSVDDKEVKVNSQPRRRHPFRGKMETFVHVITRESKYRGKGHREFERERANRIHWIKPILNQQDAFAIKVFSKEHSNKQMQTFFWYEDKDFVVLLREIQPDFLLITAYCVDKQNKGQFTRWYREYKGL